MHQIKYFGAFWGENLSNFVKFQHYQGKITLGVCKFCDFTLCKKPHCLLQKFTQLSKILHDHRG